MNKSKFQFSNPELIKLEFFVNQAFDEEKFNGIAMQSSTEIRISDGNEAYVSLTVNIGNSTESQPFYICAEMGANFRWEESVGEEKAKKLLNVNAPAVLLSYIRPIVSSMTGSSKYPALNIPFIDFTKQEADKKSF